MKYLESIEGFSNQNIKRYVDGTTNTISGYIDLINRDYNLKELKDRVIKNFDRYEINFSDLTIIYIAVLGKLGNNKFDNTLLVCRFYLNEIDFNKLNSEIIRNSRDCTIVNNQGESGTNQAFYSGQFGLNNINNSLNRDASYAVVGMHFVFDISEPDDLIMDSLSFLIKDGFEISSTSSSTSRQYVLSKKVII